MIQRKEVVSNENFDGRRHLGYEGDDMTIVKVNNDTSYIYKYKGLDEQYHVLIQY